MCQLTWLNVAEVICSSIPQTQQRTVHIAAALPYMQKSSQAGQQWQRPPRVDRQAPSSFRDSRVGSYHAQVYTLTHATLRNTSPPWTNFQGSSTPQAKTWKEALLGFVGR